MQFLETLCAIDAQIEHLKYHQKRVNNTLGNDTLLLSKILNPPKKGCYRCRIVYDNKDVCITYHPYRLHLPQSFKLVHANSLDYHFKYANRQAIDDLKQAHSAYDEILIVKNNLITDTSIANVAFLDKDRWISPKTPLLEGTTRMRLIEEGLLHVSDISLDAMSSYQGFAVMNAMTGFQIIQNGIMSLKK
ncbi:MAG: aminotransferase class IV [Campylobacterota bacterium]|nr:aminotransferase class IV [Campylobacterota bacterium]